jgi:hypothetical protein
LRRGKDVAHVDSKDQVAADCEKVKGASPKGA